MIFLDTNVFEETIRRLNKVFDHFDDVIVSMSGGKDSTVLFHLALQIATERGRLPLKVFWLDQEAEWQHTVDYMRKIMYRDDVQPCWFQIPFNFTNALSPEHNFLRVWDEDKEDMWIHPKDPIAIHENPTKKQRFHPLMSALPATCTTSNNFASIGGVRANESLNRRSALMNGKEKFAGETWGCAKNGRGQVLYPLYDWTDDDIWTAIAKNHWEYNPIYDLQYQYGVSKNHMRVSALIHEIAYGSFRQLQEFEPQTYKRFTARVNGSSTFNHAYHNEGFITPKQLPFMFADWKEYRDYLLEHIVQPQYRDLFRRRWQGQDGEEWYRVHVAEAIVQDIDGTANANFKSHMNLKKYIENAKEEDRKNVNRITAD